MKKIEAERLRLIMDAANRLMNAGPTGSMITSMDVFEAVMGDLSLVLDSQAPKYLGELVDQDRRETAAQNAYSKSMYSNWDHEQAARAATAAYQREE